MDQLSRSCLPELSLPQLPDGSAAWHTTVTSALDWYAWAGEQVSSLVEPSLEQTGAPNQTTTKKPELVTSPAGALQRMASFERSPHADSWRTLPAPIGPVALVRRGWSATTPESALLTACCSVCSATLQVPEEPSWTETLESAVEELARQTVSAHDSACPWREHGFGDSSITIVYREPTEEESAAMAEVKAARAEQQRLRKEEARMAGRGGAEGF